MPASKPPSEADAWRKLGTLVAGATDPAIGSGAPPVERAPDAETQAAPAPPIAALASPGTGDHAPIVAAKRDDRLSPASCRAASALPGVAAAALGHAGLLTALVLFAHLPGEPPGAGESIPIDIVVERVAPVGGPSASIAPADAPPPEVVGAEPPPAVAPPDAPPAASDGQPPEAAVPGLATSSLPADVPPAAASAEPSPEAPVTAAATPPAEPRTVPHDPASADIAPPVPAEPPPPAAASVPAPSPVSSSPPPVPAPPAPSVPRRAPSPKPEPPRVALQRRPPPAAVEPMRRPVTTPAREAEPGPSPAEIRAARLRAEAAAREAAAVRQEAREAGAARAQARREVRDRREIARAGEAARAAPPARGAVEPGDDGGQDAAEYGRRVAARIASLKRYPDEARARGAQGTAVVSFALDGGGNVRSAGIARSSGDATLDAEAVATVRRAGAFGPPPRGVSRVNSVSLRYFIR